MTSAALPTPTMPTMPTSHGLDQYPVAVIGAGPVGLAAAAELIERGVDVIVFEAGDAAGTSVAAWGHTRLFSPWQYLVDDAAVRLLDRAGWVPPEATRLPFGHELVSDYLRPLAATAELAPNIRYGSTVTDVSRRGMDRTRTAGRGATPFLLRIRPTAGAADGATTPVTEQLARAVIDTSGTFTTPNGLTSSGLAPTDADAVRRFIRPALPDVLGVDRADFAGRHTLVVGAGHSAANTLLKLAALAKQEPGTTITWAVRSASPVRAYGSAADELEARGLLGTSAHDLVRSHEVTLVDHFEIDDVRPAHDGLVTVLGRREGVRTAMAVDLVVNATGFQPNLDMLREIRLSLDDVVEAPRALATLIDPNLHSCGSVEPHGVVELSHPEPNFYIAGMKSYGRAPTFLLLTGYEQVRSIADELAGNHEAARSVRLVLPETGVCNSGNTADVSVSDAGGCCSANPVRQPELQPAGAGGCC